MSFKCFALAKSRERSFHTTQINRAGKFLNHSWIILFDSSINFPLFRPNLLLRTKHRGKSSACLSLLTETTWLSSRGESDSQFWGEVCHAVVAGLFLHEKRSVRCVRSNSQRACCDRTSTSGPTSLPRLPPWHRAVALGWWGTLLALRPLSMTEPGNEVTLAQTQTGRGRPTKHKHVTQECVLGTPLLWLQVITPLHHYRSRIKSLKLIKQVNKKAKKTQQKNRLFD